MWFSRKKNTSLTQVKDGFHWHLTWNDVLVYISYIAYAGCSMVLPLVLLEMSRALGFDIAQQGLARGGLLRLAQSLSMVSGMLLSLLLVNRISKKSMLCLAALLFGAGIGGMSLCACYSHLFAAMLAFGLGAGFFEAMATNLISELHQGEQPGRYINITHSCWSIGTIVTPLFIGLAVANGASWKGVSGTTGAIALICGIFWLMTLRKPHTTAETCPAGSKTGLGTILLRKELYLFLAGIFIAGGMEHSLLFWLPSYIRMEYPNVQNLANISTVLFALGMFAGRFSSGFLFSQERLPWVLIINSAIAAFAGIWIPLLHTLWVLYLLFFMIGYGLGPLWPTIQSCCAEAMGREHATIVYVILPCIGIPGCGIMVWLMGIAGDWLTLRNSFFLVSICGLIQAALFVGYYGKKIFSHKQGEASR